jgi:hypothetical protein
MNNQYKLMCLLVIVSILLCLIGCGPRMPDVDTNVIKQAVAEAIAEEAQRRMPHAEP